jgi:hypothetical protein
MGGITVQPNEIYVLAHPGHEYLTLQPSESTEAFTAYGGGPAVLHLRQVGRH